MFPLHFADYLLRRGLKHLIVHVTNFCNFRCHHCFVDFSPKKDLPLETYQRLGEQTRGLYWLDIGGGEPSLREDLGDIVLSFDAKVVQIPSNASRQEALLGALKQIQRSRPGVELAVSLSLDGLKARHEAIRGQPGNWDQVWHTFEALRRMGGVSVKINTVLHQQNVEEIPALMDEVWSHRPDFHSIILLRGDPLNPSYQLPPLDTLRAFQPELYTRWGRYTYGRGPLSAGILRNYHRALWELSLKTLEEQTQVVPCLAGKAHAVVMGDGAVSACEMLPPTGNLTQASWGEIQRSSAWAQQVRDIEARKCHCTHNCALFDSIVFRPRSYARLLRPHLP